MPDRGEYVLFADDACPVADQVLEQIEYLRLDRDQVSAAAQFPPLGIEHTTCENKIQSPRSRKPLKSLFINLQ